MKALTVGGAMIDTIASIANERIERMTMRNADTSFLLLEEGRKNEAEDISTHCGGGAVNAAVALARLGHDVTTLVKLGQDARAESILNRLSEEGVSTRFAVRDARAPTGASVLISAHDRNAAIFTFRGANTLLEAADIKTDAFAVDLVYVSSLSNDSADHFPLIVERAKANGALVATNPGIRQLSARQSAFRDVIASIDLLAVNRLEANVLVPWLVAQSRNVAPSLKHHASEELPDLARRGFHSGGFELSLAGFFDALHEAGPKWVVVTDGKNGAYLSTSDGIVYCPAPLVTVAGTAGAGDAFGATCAAYVAAAASPEEAAFAATANAASVTGYLDTQSGLLRTSELHARMSVLREALKVTLWPRT